MLHLDHRVGRARMLARHERAAHVRSRVEHSADPAQSRARLALAGLLLWLAHRLVDQPRSDPSEA